MERATGIGGIFFKCDDPEKMYQWYEKHLGLKRVGGAVGFEWRHKDEDKPGMTVWSLFPRTSTYFDPSQANFMINYCVENLDALLERLRAEGVEIDPKREDHEYGRFAWIMDPEGNRIELWEPPKTQAM
ncbi:MAG TPA: VOC family protein [Terriglobales bacterium]|nr:VOC family protein [Terriglobales bacterium]